MDQEAYKKHNKPEKGAQPGVYTHPNIPGEELHAGNFGQADAFVRQGWVYDRQLPSRLNKLETDRKTEADAAAKEATKKEAAAKQAKDKAAKASEKVKADAAAKEGNKSE